MITNVTCGECGNTLEVEFDYTPAEPMTWDYPGCKELVDVYEDVKCEVCDTEYSCRELEDMVKQKRKERDVED